MNPNSRNFINWLKRSSPPSPTSIPVQTKRRRITPTRRYAIFRTPLTDPSLAPLCQKLIAYRFSIT